MKKLQISCAHTGTDAQVNMDDNITSERFYSELPVYDDLRCIADADRFTDVPADWYVIIADVIDSTGAIKKGQYREINTIGVAALTAVLNAMKDVAIPYVFGGDGATLCVPARYLSQATNALSATVDMARQSFGLELRVGYMPITQILSNASSLKVARCRMSRRLVTAMFAGDGLDYAEGVIKGAIKNRNFIEISGNEGHEADFTGFECRWQEIPSRYGETISLLVKATTRSINGDAIVYAETLDLIESIYGNEEKHHPLDVSKLRLSFNRKKLGQELEVRTYEKGGLYKKLYWLKLLVQNIFGTLFLGYNFKTATVDWKNYKLDLVKNTDYKKFDGMLRMVIAGNERQRQKLVKALNEREDKNELIYGLNVSDAAQITCLVYDHKQDHIHFVDGAGGGYSLAALELKKKRQEKDPPVL